MSDSDANTGIVEKGYLANLKYDVPASVVVFLIALPLCLGIAVASGAPPLAGLLSGVIGGMVVAWASGSALAVSGPAAGLIAIVLPAIATLGYDGFLLAVVISGVLQVGLGQLRAGIFAYYFPSGVIKGLLAAIGIILILKQIPHALGYDADFEGDLTLYWNGELGAWHEISFAFDHVHPGAALIAALGIAVLIIWERVPALKRLNWMPGPLVVVILGVVLNAVFAATMPGWVIRGEHLVSLPEGGIPGFLAQLTFPNFSRLGELPIWQTGVILAAVASIETLLCIEALDKLDPQKRLTPTNRELKAQGLGNIIAGLIGALPITAVIVRGSANVHSGGRTRMSAFLHGVLLLLAILMLPWAMALIPLAALAAILLHIGYKLARVEIFQKMLRQDAGQWAPFLTTVIAIVATDLLTGTAIGMAVAFFFILRANLQTPYFIHHQEVHLEERRNHITIELSENVSFLNKASVNKVLHQLPDGSLVTIDGSGSHYVHPDVLELIEEFATTAQTRGIAVELRGLQSKYPEGNAPPDTPGSTGSAKALRHVPTTGRTG